jgi:hypothetical protein
MSPIPQRRKMYGNGLAGFGRKEKFFLKFSNLKSAITVKTSSGNRELIR